MAVSTWAAWVSLLKLACALHARLRWQSKPETKSRMARIRSNSCNPNRSTNCGPNSPPRLRSLNERHGARSKLAGKFVMFRVSIGSHLDIRQLPVFRTTVPASQYKRCGSHACTLLQPRTTALRPINAFRPDGGYRRRRSLRPKSPRTAPWLGKATCRC